LQYLFAVEGDVAEGLSSDGDDDQLFKSSHSASGSTSSSHSDKNCSESSASDFVNYWTCHFGTCLVNGFAHY
jgi:hypothetical protein